MQFVVFFSNRPTYLHVNVACSTKKNEFFLEDFLKPKKPREMCVKEANRIGVFFFLLAPHREKNE